MTWLWRLVATSATAAMLLACGGDDAGSGSGGSAGAGGGASVDGVAVTFSDAGPLVLAPGQRTEVRVSTQPPGEHAVTFLLLGESLDASLDRDAPVADASGVATVLLQAPSKAAAFELRAVVGDGPPAQIVVRVTELGTGVVRVLPTYAGVRNIETWTAVVVPRASCPELSAAAPIEPEDALVATAPEGEELVVEDVPVGPRLAVVARSGTKVWGCAEAVLERASVTEDVEVAALDRPVQLGAADLAVELLVDGDGTALAPILETARGRIVEAAMPTAAEPATVLLDAMAPHLPVDDREGFAAAREGGVDEAVAADLAAREVDVHATLLELVSVDAAPPGPVTGRLLSAAGGSDHAVFAIEQLLGVDGSRAGVPDDHLVSFVVNPGDTVVVGGVLFFLPTRLLGALAEDALDEGTPGLVPADVLSSAVDCAAVAASVGPVGTCDLVCLADACGLAVGDLWSRGLDGSAQASDLGALSIAVSGAGRVDDDASLVGFDGSWVGVMSAGTDEVAVGGPASAESTADDGRFEEGSDAPEPRE